MFFSFFKLSFRRIVDVRSHFRRHSPNASSNFQSDPTLEGARQMHPPIFKGASYFRKDPIPGPSWYEILKNTQHQDQAGMNLSNIPNTRTKLV